MTKQTCCPFSALTLLVHTKIASFEWGKTVIEVFQRHAVRNKLTLRTVYRWQDVADSDMVVLVGVDKPWLKVTLQNGNGNHANITCDIEDHILPIN